MDKRNTPVVKSNSTSEAKKNNNNMQKNNKKSRSSAEFQARITVTDGQGPLKRRGVYVEKKSIKIPLNNGVRSPARSNSPKAQRRIPRPDKKRFLTNVLTLLSKSTVGTQSFVPDSTEIEMEKTKQRLKKKKEEFFVKELITSPVIKRKPKYKSKSINYHDVIVNGELDSLIVLQSTKQIIQTPSNNSECVFPIPKKGGLFTKSETMNWATPHPPSHRHDLDLETNTLKGSHSKKVKIEEHTAEERPNREEKNIYNFFVNVLKTTLSGCDVKPALDLPTSVKSSKLSMEIDEAVAKKLNMENKEPKPTEVSQKPSCNSKCFYVDVLDETQWDENFKPQFKKQYRDRAETKQTTKKNRKQNLNTSSLIRQYRLAAKPSVPKTRTPMPRKKAPIKPKQNKKRDFIDSLKQELQFHQEEQYEKPSFFKALKAMAKHKKRQSVNFRTARKPSDDDVCQLKCHKVLSAKSSKNKQSIYIPQSRQISRQATSYKKQHQTIFENSDEDSMHSNYSLEVIGYDDNNVNPQVKTNLLIHHPSDVTDEDFNFPVVNFSSSCCNVQIVA